MRLRVVSIVLSCSAIAAVWACSLNPQPLPPDGYDASTDGVLATSPDGSGSADGSTKDSGMPPADDAASDASDDASDAGDAAEDARADDASDDASDAGEDG